jgi:hypothetical protein
MPQSERNLIHVRILECETRMADQRRTITRLQSAGSDTASAVYLLSAMESGQAMRLRRLAALA